MAFRRAAYWKSMGKGVQGSPSSSFATSTLPKWKAYADHVDPSSSSSSSSGSLKSRFPKGDMFPVMMAVGMIGIAGGFGIFTAWHQLGHGPNIYVKKSRRETIPEVVEPDEVAQEAQKFVKRSFFRKVAHVQDSDHLQVMPDPIRADIFAREPKVETLRDVGVDPAAAAASSP